MTNTNAPVLIYVTYQGGPETRFDRTYYVERHLPLVMDAWRQYGLENIAAYFPAATQAGTIAICDCRFASENAMQTAFASAETPSVMADVVQFTDVAPERARAVALRGGRYE